MTYVPFSRQSVGDERRGFSGEQALNWYLQPWPSAAAGEVMLEPCPGLTRRRNLNRGEVYAVLELNNWVYAAAGGKLVRVNRNTNALQELGDIAADPFTTIATNGTDVAVASGGDLQVFTRDGGGGTFTSPATGVFNDVGSVDCLNGYMIITEQTGKRFSFSALGDATDWDALDFFTAESAPDQIRRVIVHAGEAYIFGTRSTEVWSVVGGSDILAKNPGGDVPRGILWGASAVSTTRGVFFVGDDRIVYAMNGYQPQRVSTVAVERILENYDQDADVTAFSYTYCGRVIYVLRFADRAAWCLDTETGFWHERNTGINGTDPWIARCAAFFDETQIIGTSTGVLANLGGLTDDGDVIARQAVSVPFVVGGRYITLDKLEAHFQTGEQDIGRDAQVMMQMRRKTRRDWRTWGDERWRSLGRIGEDVVAHWDGLGGGYGFQIRLRVTDPIDAPLYGVTYEPRR